MGKAIFYFGIVLIFLQACNNSGKSRQNDRRINPATIAQIDTANYTAIEWEDTTRNFGTVKEGDSVFVKFRFKNSGEKVLFVISAHSSCGCAAVGYPEEPVLPGEKSEVTAAFKNKYQPGFVHQTIVVTTNTVNKRYHTLTFEGQVTDSSHH